MKLLIFYSISFIVAILVSIFSFKTALSNLCFSGGWIGGGCHNKTPELFLPGMIFPFIFFAICAILCGLYFSKNKAVISDLQKVALVFLGAFPFLFLGLFFLLLLGGSFGASTSYTPSQNNKSQSNIVNKQRLNECPPKPEDIKKKVVQSSMSIRVKKVKVVRRTNKLLLARFTVEVKNIPPSISKIYFDINFSRKPQMSKDELSKVMMHPTPPILITQKNGKVTFNKGGLGAKMIIHDNGEVTIDKGSSSVFEVQKSFYFTKPNEVLPKKGIYSLSIGYLNCTGLQIHELIDLPNFTL